MWYEIKDNFLILYVRALPNSSKNQICDVMEDTLKIKLKAPAVEGAANKELVKFLSKTFKISKSDIEFLSGQTSKRKRLKMPLNEKILSMIKEQNG